MHLVFFAGPSPDWQLFPRTQIQRFEVVPNSIAMHLLNLAPRAKVPGRRSPGEGPLLEDTTAFVAAIA
jgi:hypothetical protein